MKEINLKEKSVYGNTLVYPNCTDIHYIEKLGYKVNVQKL